MSNLLRWVPQEAGTRWNRVRLYTSTTMTGTFTLLKEIESSYCYWWDENSPTTQYYKLSWYDSAASVESALSDAFTTSTVMITTKELRRYMGLKDADQPDDNIMMGLILDANTEFQVDKNFSDTNPSKLALKMLSASLISQWRAQQIINSGNVNFSIDGISVQRPYQFFMEQAKYWRTQYDEFIWKYAEESMVNLPISDAGYPDQSDMLVEIISGVNNARNMLDLRSLNSNIADTAIIVVP